MPNLVKANPPRIDAFLEDWRIGPEDDVKLRIRGGVLTAVAKRADGRVQTRTMMLDGRFQRRTAIDTSGLSPAERRKIVRQLRKEGHRQAAIADLLGVSQATISLDLKK